MREARAWLALLRHGLNLLRTGQLRFRLETFGLYYPALPYKTPAWKISSGPALLLVGQARRYAHWLREMDDLRQTGAQGWWDQKR